MAFAFHKPVDSQRANEHLSLIPYTLLLPHLRSTVSSQFTLYFWRHVYSGTYSSLELRGNTKNSDIYFAEVTGTVSEACMKCRKSSKSSCKCLHTKWGLLLLVLAKGIFQISHVQQRLLASRSPSGLQNTSAYSWRYSEKCWKYLTSQTQSFLYEFSFKKSKLEEN